MYSPIEYCAHGCQARQHFDQLGWSIQANRSRSSKRQFQQK